MAQTKSMLLAFIWSHLSSQTLSLWVYCLLDWWANLLFPFIDTHLWFFIQCFRLCRLYISFFLCCSSWGLSGPLLLQLFMLCNCSEDTCGPCPSHYFLFLTTMSIFFLSIYYQCICLCFCFCLLKWDALTKTWHLASFLVESPLYLSWIAVLQHILLMNG